MGPLFPLFSAFGLKRPEVHQSRLLINVLSLEMDVEHRTNGVLAVAPPAGHFAAGAAAPENGHNGQEAVVLAADVEDQVENVANGSADEDDVREELEREVDALMADRVYHDFVENVVTHKEIKEDDTDGDFVADEVGEGDAGEDAGALSDSSTSTLTDPEDYEDAQEQVEVKIPKQALMEAEQRFPPFWRMKHAMKNESMTEYKSDEDPDYKTDEEDDDDKESSEEVNPDGQMMKTEEWRSSGPDGLAEASAEGDHGGVDAIDSSGDESEDFDEDVMKAEVDELKVEMSRDLQDDVDGLAEMVEYMTLPPSSAGETLAAAAAAAEAVLEDEEDMEEETAAAGQSILELDVDGYVSGEDPDFKPDPELLERVDDQVSESESNSSSDDDGCTVERME